MCLAPPDVDHLCANSRDLANVAHAAATISNLDVLQGTTLFEHRVNHTLE